MPPKKRSFFEKLSGALPADEYDVYDDDTPRRKPEQPYNRLAVQHSEPKIEEREEEQTLEGQLPVDMFQTDNEIIIRAFVAGVRPDELTISISRDQVEIEGSRETREQVATDSYSYQELFWGSFTRTIALPDEIDVDASSAGAKDGLLTIVMPKLDRTRQTKLRVKSG